MLSIFKSSLLGVRKFLAAESPLKLMKNAFYITLKALFVLKIFKFLSWLFGHPGKRFGKKVKFNFKICDVKDWEAINYNTHVAQHLKEERQPGNEIWSVHIR